MYEELCICLCPCPCLCICVCHCHRQMIPDVNPQPTVNDCVLNRLNPSGRRGRVKKSEQK